MTNERLKKRPWFQIHLSTCVILLIVSAMLIGVNIVFQVPRSSEYSRYPVVLRGWPLYWAFQSNPYDDRKTAQEKLTRILEMTLEDYFTELESLEDAFQAKANSGEYSLEELEYEHEIFSRRINSLFSNYSRNYDDLINKARFYADLENSIGSGYRELAINGVVGAGILALVAVACEWVIRRRGDSP